jgi:nitrate reductase NapE component
VLTVKSGLDPHMITELEDELKSCSLVVLAICLWRILSISLC